jgi:hypothetical protein
VAIVGAILLPALGALPGINWERPAGSSSLTRPVSYAAGADPGIAVSPEAWTMVAGQSVPLRAYLLEPTNGCVAGSVLFTWLLVGDGDRYGYLNVSEGAKEVFTAFLYGAGSATVNVSLLGLEWCGGWVRTFSTSTEVSIRIVAPMAADGLVPSSDPVPTDHVVTISTLVRGGLPPYRVVFAYGDGASEGLTSGLPGEVSVPHRYSAGTYLPTAQIRDSLGESQTASSTVPLVVTERIAVVIDAPTLRPDVGVPLLLQASVLPNNPFTVLWNDSEGHRGTGDTWSLTPSFEGPDLVTAVVWGSVGPLGNASLELAAQPPVNVSLPSTRLVVDVGQPVPVSIQISGGSPPYRVYGVALPKGSGFNLTGVTGRSLSEVLVSSSVGEMWARVTVVDSLGGNAVELSPLATVADSPRLFVNISPSPGELGQPLRLVAKVSGGVAPFNWSITSTGALDNGTPLSGVVGRGGLFAWTGTMSDAGAPVFQVGVTDAAGAPAAENVTVPVLPALSLNVDPLPKNITAGHPLVIAAEVNGGHAPYTSSFLLSDGELHLVNTTGPGIFAWSPDPTTPGLLRVQVTVHDGIGAVARSELTVTVSPLSSAPSAPPTPKGPVPPPSGDLLTSIGGGIGAVAGLGFIGLVGWVLLRRRGALRVASNVRSSSGALLAIRRFLQESESIDRETLLLLAEEEGFDSEEASAALRRWSAIGRVRKESVAGGETVYRWSTLVRDDPPIAASDGGLDEGAA